MDIENCPRLWFQVMVKVWRYHNAFLLIVEKLICVEDVIHELLTCGSLFQKASNMLWPFKLSSPNGGWRKKGRHYVDGGDFGNREEKINVLLKKMI